MFGSKPFGGGTSFGQQQPTGGFGASGSIFGATSTPASTGGGLFGTSGSAFGQAQPQQSGTGGFTFGAQNPTSSSGSLFGGTASTPASAGGGLFATPAASTAFGAKTPGGFGATTQQQTSGSLFGSNAASTGTSLFGGTTQTTSTAGSSLFGGFGQQTSQQGGTLIKFNPPSGSDTMMKGGTSQSIQTRHQCITAMKEYEAKSLEELRFEDYGAGRKGPQAATAATAGGLFGATTNTSSGGFGGFGANQAAKPAGFGFGGTTTATTSGGLFGATTQAGGLFGTTQNKSLFGATTTTSTATSGFGGFGAPSSGTTGGLFGANTAQKPGGLFGATSTPATASVFGTAQPNTSGFGTLGASGGFGQPSQPAGGLFGAAKPAFGSAPTSSSGGFNFGNTSTQTGGIFGNNKPATATSGFNFGATASSGGFGTPQNAGGLFAQRGTTGFGTNTLGGGFGTSNTLGGGLGTGTSIFNNQAKPGSLTLGTNFGGGTGGFGTLGGTSTAGLLGGNTIAGNQASSGNAQTQQLQQVLTALANSPYGDNALFRSLKQDDSKREELLKPTNPAAQKAVLQSSSQYKISPRPTAKIKPKPLHSIANGKAQLFDGLEEEDNASFGNDSFIPRRSIKKLVIKNGGLNNSVVNQSSLDHSIGNKNHSSPNIASDETLNPPTPVLSSTKFPDSTTKLGDCDDTRPPVERIPSTSSESNSGMSQPPSLDDTMAELNRRNNVRNALEESRLESSLDTTQDNLSDRSGSPPPPHPTGIVLHRPGYYTMPALDELSECMDDNGNCFIENFVVGREGYGNVMFPGVTNVARINLDEIIFFRRKEITIYPDDDNKPTVGKGLNKKAQVTLDCVWPNDKTTRLPIKDPDRLQEMKYEEKLENASAKIGAKFMDYLPETGSWVFQVKHFSKYGLLDDDSDDEDGTELNAQKLEALKQQQDKQLALQKQQFQLKQQKILQQQQERADGDEQLTAAKHGGLQPEPMVDEDSDDNISNIMQERFPEESCDMDDDEDSHAHRVQMDMVQGMTEEGDHIPTSHKLAMGLGVRAEELQIKKASFFGEDDEDYGEDQYTFKSAKSQWHAGLGGNVIGGPQQTMVKSVHPTLPQLTEPWLGEKSLFSTSFRGMPQRESPGKIASPVQRRAAFKEQSNYQAFNVKPKPAPVEHPVIPSGMTYAERPKRVVGNRIQRSVPPLKESFFYQRQSMLLDQALFMGRTFRVGWGPQWLAAHPGKPISEQDKMDKQLSPTITTGGDKRFSLMPTSASSHSTRRLDASPYELVVEAVHMAPYAIEGDEMITSLISKCMEIQLKNSTSTSESGCPLFVPTPGVEALHEYAELLQNEKQNRATSRHEDLECVEHMSLVWELCVALWGDLPELAGLEGENQNYIYHLMRREALSKWLTAAAYDNINDEVHNNNYKGDHDIHAVLSHLTGRHISQACLRAQEAGDHRLALLVAQAAGSEMNRHMLKKQLSRWRDNKVDEFIPSSRLKVYALLAGFMVWDSSQEVVNVCENLDWKRCLALHLWYHCSPTASIADALAEYNKAYRGKNPHGKYACQPSPPYLEEGRDVNTEDIQDMCYHLLKLYCDRSHELHSLLNPSTTTPNNLDYRLSWHVSQVLHALQYHHLSDYHHASLCCSYASQLEALGLWQWAAFVLLHIINVKQRQWMVTDLLMRHVSVESDDNDESVTIENFLQNQLHIPSQWIHDAKAVKAKSENRTHEEALHLLKAGKWNECHIVILTNVASDAIINENYDYLKRLLQELGSSEHAPYIKNWDTGGKVYLDYINMMQTLEQLKQGKPSVYELEKLQPEVTSLAGRISQIQCRNAQDRLCQAEMAKRMAILTRTLASMQTAEGGELSARLLAPIISQLPMPEDYALQELRQLTRSHLLEVTMS